MEQINKRKLAVYNFITSYVLWIICVLLYYFVWTDAIMRIILLVTVTNIFFDLYRVIVLNRAPKKR